jgi:hypothetical protein
MGNSRLRIGVAAAAFIIILIAGAILYISKSPAASSPKLTLAAAEQEVLGQYSGEIVGGKEQGDAYIIQLKSVQGLYELTVKQTGITGIRALERYGTEAPGSSPGAASPEPTADGGGSPEPTEAPSAKPSQTPAPSESTSPDATQETAAPAATSKPTANPSILISEAQAAKLALKKVPGKVKDIDKENEGGKWYYFVEIETSNGREADVQLNAASGAVISVTWDDDADDD